MTPMQEQYNQIKQAHPDEIVLFRLGDFYEAFHDDAHTISKVLGITLTGRGKDEKRIPMAGIPHHALDNYLPKLLKAGLKVAMVNQLTEPKPGELVERDVTKIYTPGTLVGDNMLEDSQNNYLASIYIQNEKQGAIFGIAFVDVSTGKLQVFETRDTKVVAQEISRLAPSEIVVSQSQRQQIDIGGRKAIITERPEQDFAHASGYKTATAQFGTSNLKGFGIEELSAAVSALGGLLSYLHECQKTDLTHLKQVSIYTVSDYMLLDDTTIRNLELLWPSRGTDTSNTLFSVLNYCQTNMGKRKLRDWLVHPYIVAEPLVQRWEAVGYLSSNEIFNSKLRDQLNQITDIERIVGKLGVGSANARDLIGLQVSLETTKALATMFAGATGNLGQRLQHLYNAISSSTVAQQIIDLIAAAIEPDPPATISEGGMIRTGYNSEVDELRSLRRGGKETLASIQTREVARTGISSLKVSYNNVFGYYIEITKTHNHKVPDDYIRKQTLTNAERYITPELKEWEDKILNAEDKLIRLEHDLFVAIRSQIATFAQELLYLADIIAELDVLTNFAYVAKQYKYTKPELNTSKTAILQVKDGRHPVVERLLSQFTVNDVEFDKDTDIVVLTGPNMSGKSTYIRQTALIVLLAQIGCFVPASKCELTLVDRIFTRVGASDNLSQGESTFMVEMNETANILNNATERSLIILDEVGRGTSTYDGVAIAWAIVEFIQQNIRANTLFATHYHELIALAEEFTSIKNYHVQVSETDGKVLFTHKIKPGSTSRSYGVHVAEMAGVPQDVIKRATDILTKFESKGSTPRETSKVKSPAKPRQISPQQLSLLD
jgi:DNA mismatch repair protein MutS